jgi:hypothetical protein
MALTTPTGADLAEKWLAAAYDLVERGWCQGAAATDATGRPVAPDSAAARAWSLGGALTRSWREHGADDETGLSGFQLAHLALSAAVHEAPAVWNDTPGRRKGEVLEALVRAVSLVQDPALFGARERAHG